MLFQNNLSMTTKILIVGSIGNMVQFYEFSLFGFMVSKFASLFFPAQAYLTSLILTFGVFATGFLMRPLGAIIFGHIGDNLGRKSALSLSLMLMIVPTLIIATTPTYEQIGILAPLLICLARILQGLCIGVEYNGSMVFTLENFPSKEAGFVGGILAASPVFGMLCGMISGYIFTLPGLPSEFWRLAFILGTVLGVLGTYVRSRIGESPEFAKVKSMENKSFNFYEFLFFIRRNYIKLFITIGIGGLCGAHFYIQFVFLTNFLQIVTPVDPAILTRISIFSLITYMVLLPIMGKLSDIIGNSKLMGVSSTFTIILAYPIFVTFQKGVISGIMLSQLVLSLLTATFAAPCHGVMQRMFSTTERYTGISVGYNMGIALMGSSTPLISTFLFKLSENPTSPAIYLALIGLCGFWATRTYINNYELGKKQNFFVNS
ncbi:MAG: hypothetical protein BGO67_00175 [Alphaproteobacteria bacterium 41-28]|nr:MAG: hypothetical protein BGO67_00175 [Alphaproteobacteria bacterium 41-28]